MLIEDIIEGTNNLIKYIKRIAFGYQIYYSPTQFDKEPKILEKNKSII